jgi:hypothetical protein
MLILEGKVLGVVYSERIDTAGVIEKRAQVEVLHRIRGKSRVDTVRIDPSVSAAWEKADGKDVRIEVDYYALLGSEGGVISGFMMADKKALPLMVPSPSLKVA